MDYVNEIRTDSSFRSFFYDFVVSLEMRLKRFYILPYKDTLYMVGFENFSKDTIVLTGKTKMIFGRNPDPKHYREFQIIRIEKRPTGYFLEAEYDGATRYRAGFFFDIQTKEIMKEYSIPYSQK